ncbi:MAG: hypothetical protein KIG36_05575 [Eubacteriales bacterium]|nr:hypothetical protein [Eubacteriales bacterium]
MAKEKTRLLLMVFGNLLLIVLEIIGLVQDIFLNGWSLFQYYTEDSSILMLIASVALFVCLTARLDEPERPIPVWVWTLYYAAVCCVTVTFTVVIFVLAPMIGWDKLGWLLAHGPMLYHHTLCPILAILLFAWMGKSGALPRRPILYALIPTLLYAAVVIPLNFARVLTGQYPFLLVYEQPLWMSALWCVLIIGGAAGLAWLIYLSGKRRKRS